MLFKLEAVGEEEDIVEACEAALVEHTEEPQSDLVVSAMEATGMADII